MTTASERRMIDERAVAACGNNGPLDHRGELLGKGKVIHNGTRVGVGELGLVRNEGKGRCVDGRAGKDGSRGGAPASGLLGEEARETLVRGPGGSHHGSLIGVQRLTGGTFPLSAGRSTRGHHVVKVDGSKEIPKGDALVLEKSALGLLLNAAALCGMTASTLAGRRDRRGLRGGLRGVKLTMGEVPLDGVELVDAGEMEGARALGCH